MNRRGFLQACLAAGAAPAIVRIGSLMSLSAPKIWLSEKSLEDAIIAIRSMTNSRGILIATHPKILWPGVKAWWDAHYDEASIHKLWEQQ